MKRRTVVLGLVSVLLAGTPFATSTAQRGEQRGGGRANRQELEQRLRQRLSNLLRTQLGLDNEQMRRLSDVNQSFDRQRRDLFGREMLTRRGLREQVLRRDSADVARIEQLLADQFRIERERIDLTEAEQRELGKFLTAIQRAQYLAVQEQIRREMDQLRGRGMPAMGPPPGEPGRPVRRRPPPG